MNTIQKIKGFADLFEPESAAFTFLEAKAREVFSRYGFKELRTPILEKTELFARSIGEETDVVQKEMYTFTDRGDRSVTMRPEATAGVCRAYLESGGYAPGQVAKLFTLGPMFRYERPQKGRMRQFHQINAEIIGSPAAQADAELMLMLASFLDAVGVSGVSFEVNSLGCPDCRPAYREALVAHLKGIDTETLCSDCVRRMETNPLRVLDCKVPGCKEATQGAPSVTEHLCDECSAHYAEVLDTIREAGLAFTENPRLVRGLDYYRRTTFEVVSGDIGAQSSVAGGGRYDGLISLIGGPEVPATGFACGMERLSLLIEPPQDGGIDFYLAVMDAPALTRGMILAEHLRRAGLKGETAFESKSMKSQMRAANRLGARVCLILGSREQEEGTIVIKDMAEGGQQTVSQADLIANPLLARK